MWIVQKDMVLQIPDDAPLPPDSRVIDVPADFARDGGAFTFRNGAFTRRATPPTPPKLTPEEVEILKAAIASGRLDRRPK